MVGSVGLNKIEKCISIVSGKGGDGKGHPHSGH